MSAKDVENKLKDLSKNSPNSSWKERKEYSKKNRAWFKKSVDIALKVLDVLDARNMSQAELATKLKVSRQQVSKIVKGQENLTLETISKLEDVLGVTLMVVPENETDKSFTVPVAVEPEAILSENNQKMIKPILYHSFEEKKQIERNLFATMPKEKRKALAVELMSIFHTPVEAKKRKTSKKTSVKR